MLRNRINLHQKYDHPEFGVEAPVARNAVFSLSYAGQFGGGMRDNGVRASLSWNF